MFHHIFAFTKVNPWANRLTYSEAIWMQARNTDEQWKGGCLNGWLVTMNWHCLSPRIWHHQLASQSVSIHPKAYTRFATQPLSRPFFHGGVWIPESTLTMWSGSFILIIVHRCQRYQGRLMDMGTDNKIHAKATNLELHSIGGNVEVMSCQWWWCWWWGWSQCCGERRETDAEKSFQTCKKMCGRNCIILT